MDERIGDEYQRRTKYTRENLRDGWMLDWDNKPPTYKEYPDAPRLELPVPAPRATMDLDRALRERRSVRDFTPQPLFLEDLSYLIRVATGIQRREEGYAFRTAPSAGALYPVETYVSAYRMEGLAPGIYHYAIEPHALEMLREGELGREVARGALGQGICAGAAAVFLWTAVFLRSKWKYRQHAYR